MLAIALGRWFQLSGWLCLSARAWPQGTASCCLNGRLTELLELDSDRDYQWDSLYCSWQQGEPNMFHAPWSRSLLGICLLCTEVLLLSPGWTNGVIARAEQERSVPCTHGRGNKRRQIHQNFGNSCYAAGWAGSSGSINLRRLGTERGQGGREENGRRGSATSSSSHTGPVPKYYPSSHVPTASKSRVNTVHPGCTARTCLWFFPFFHHILRLIPRLGWGTQLAGPGNLRQRGCPWGSPVFSPQLFHDIWVLYSRNEGGGKWSLLEYYKYIVYVYSTLARL